MLSWLVQTPRRGFRKVANKSSSRTQEGFLKEEKLNPSPEPDRYMMYMGGGGEIIGAQEGA